MTRVDLPQSGLRKRRRRRRVLLGLLFVFLLFVICGTLVWLSKAPFLRITAVQVVDAHTVASSTILQYAQKEIAGAYAGLFARNNIFLYPRRAIVQVLLKQYPTLRTVDVHAQDFHTVIIKVVEREPVALWCDTSCFYMDEQGLVYAPAPTFSAPVYTTYQGPATTTPQSGVRQFITPQQFQSLTALVAAFAQKLPDDPVGLVAVDQNNDTQVYFKKNFLLIFNLKDDGGDVFERFSLALGSEVFKGKMPADFEYLDLRFGDKLYYKLK
ncbi:MAG: hypothetical protein AAB919_03990 [Patescibacteria group bacterium]